ncbi:MAG: hypothetical protein JSS65_03860 [Armatimonadetes bacterium]|nr:hypothetical protein [Armatimonadota bacterium]
MRGGLSLIVFLLLFGCAPEKQTDVHVVQGSGPPPELVSPTASTLETVEPEIPASGAKEVRFSIQSATVSTESGWKTTEYICTFSKGNTKERFTMDLSSAMSTDGPYLTGKVYQHDFKLCPEFVKAIYRTFNVPYEGQIGAPIEALKFQYELLLEHAARGTVAGFRADPAGTWTLYKASAAYDMGGFYINLDPVNKTGTIALVETAKAKDLASYLNAVLNEKQETP